MRSRLAAALAGVAALLAAGLVAVAAPAQATNHIHASATQPEPVCEATWTMRGGSVVDGQFTWGDQPAGSSITKTKAKLVKPEGESPGVEFAAFNLDVQAPADNELLVGVKYELGDGATVAAGAVRMFGYEAQGANTVNDTPTYGPAIATNETGGNLVLVIPAGKKLGTLGLVYDASNSAKGWVKFRQMTIGDAPVWFTGCPEPEPTVTPEPTQTAEPTAEPTGVAPPVTCASFETQAEAQAAFDADPEGLANLDGDSDGKACEWGPSPEPVPTLPVTGSSTTLWLVLAGACALGAGGLLYALARRRRVQFRA